MPGRHAPASSKSFLISLGTAVGGALAALAVVVGIAVVVLNAGSGSDEPSAITSTPPSTPTPTLEPSETASPTPTETASPTPTETVSLTPVSSTTLRVLNSTNRAGLARNMADRAKAEGYPDPIVGNAAASPKSTIYYRADSQDEAERLRDQFPELTEIAPAPSSFKTDVMLTIVLGEDYPNPAPSPSPSA